MTTDTPLGAALARLGTAPRTVTLEGRPARRLAAPEAGADAILQALLAEIDTAMLAVRLVVATGEDGPRLELQAAARRLRGFDEVQAAADHLSDFARKAAAHGGALAILATPHEAGAEGAGLSVKALTETLALDTDDSDAAPADRFLGRAAPMLRAGVVRRNGAEEALGAAQDIPETRAGLAAILDGPWSSAAAERADADTPLLTAWLSAEEEDPDEAQPAIAILHWPASGNNDTEMLAILAFDPGDLPRLSQTFARAMGKAD